MNLEALRAAFRKGKKQKYVFFWKPEPPGLPGCLSQWQPAPFCLEGQGYVSAEHYMMAEKARLFGDDEALRNILRAGSPQAI